MVPEDDVLVRVFPELSESLPCWSGIVRVGAVLMRVAAASIHVGTVCSVWTTCCNRYDGPLEDRRR
ncbi:hypothetical protein DPMN_074146 [Dreissena polymorpha]|uniref:Uncharacterized protein n=1 Tax=Dreissena polymorpha TaxID=45954 RepID=A0A9D3YES8_DREPO|nr:hypothetical protein DPMN_074146 [Dreissena polymorpha]